MAYKEGQLLGFKKNGSPVYMAASAENPIDPGVVAGSILIVGFIALAAMVGVMKGETKRRKKVIPRMKIL